MAQPPAVVIIARHGPRLDGANREWHLSTPTPYDPPLTYGGWNQCRALGVRIASLLYAREQSINGPHTSTNEPPTPAGVFSRDFATGARSEDGARRRAQRKKHKVVIHTSPFLRCIETSVAIAAGIAQFVPTSHTDPGSTATRTTGSAQARSMRSPRLSSTGHGTHPGRFLLPDPSRGLEHEIVRRAVGHYNRHSRSELRVDAFLGEWMNPEYFEHITPPPPSAMMVATAKAELMQNDTIDVFTPTITTKSSHSSLWGGTSAGTRPQSRDSALEDWDDLHDALLPPSPRRDRTSSHSSVGSADSSTNKRPGYRSMPSTFPHAETIAYAPPFPTYAVSTTSTIPKGYVAHARNSCVDVDLQWDSSREPQDWGDGGELGEEWSSMHRRFRKGLTKLIYWYSQHDADETRQGTGGIDQGHPWSSDQDAEEDLVVILVTHSAGCNALIGAMTGQPVLMDVGMASLTLATRRDDAPPASALLAAPSNSQEEPFRARRGSIDTGLPQMYEMKVVASSEHLRPGYDPLKQNTASGQRTVDPINGLRPFRGDSLNPTSAPSWSPTEVQPGRNSMTTALGSIRRPNSSYFPAQVTSAPSSKASSLGPADAREAFSAPHSGATTPSSWMGGLWTPPEARTPQLAAHYTKDDRREYPTSLDAISRGLPTDDATLPLDRLTKSEEHLPQASSATEIDSASCAADDHADACVNEVFDADQVTRLENLLDDKPPQALDRGLSQTELWRSRPSGDVPEREFKDVQKRRWTFTDEQQQT